MIAGQPNAVYWSDYLSKEIKEFHDSLSKVKEAKELTNIDVRCYRSKFATWEAKVRELKQLKIKIHEDSMDVNLDEAVATQLKTSFEQAGA